VRHARALFESARWPATCRTGQFLAEAALLAAEGSWDVSLSAANRAVRPGWPPTSDSEQAACVLALEAALQCDRYIEAADLLGELAAIPSESLPPYLRAEALHYRVLVDSTGGRVDGVAERFAAAEDAMRRLGYPFQIARVLLDRGSWLLQRQARVEAAVLLAEAAGTFESLRVLPLRQRAEGLITRATTQPSRYPGQLDG
jgi:hypothetical protein